MTWWDSPQWRAYEAAAGVTISRADELAQATWQTRVVDLSVSKAELWRGVRKSYRSLIHRAESHYRILGVTAMVADALTMNILRPIHAEVSGRVTRPPQTWALMGEWMRDGNGCAICAWTPGGNCAGYAYFILDGAWAYYASAASLRPNLNHALVWHALLALPARGVRWCELGWQGHALDDKGRAIEFFRRGWGGVDVPAADAPRLANPQTVEASCT